MKAAWIVATRTRRTALTLAVLAAMAAPFIFDTYDYDEYDSSYSIRAVPLTPQTRAIVIAKFENCYNAEVPPVAPLPGFQKYSTYWDPPNEFGIGGCPHARRMLQEGGYNETYLSLWDFALNLRYFVLNGTIMLATLVVTFFALTAAMAAARVWWRWWW
jgi:hypothetical protein